jgi:hypothetical protein
MKDTDKFGPEEKKHLSYLGSMLQKEPSQEEAEANALQELILKHGVRIKGTGEIIKQGGD